MKLSAPRTGSWIVALVAGVAGVLLHYRIIHIAALAPYSVSLIAGAWLLLIFATFLRGL